MKKLWGKIKQIFKKIDPIELYRKVKLILNLLKIAKEIKLQRKGSGFGFSINDYKRILKAFSDAKSNGI